FELPGQRDCFWPSLSYAHDFAAVPHGRKIIVVKSGSFFGENCGPNGFAMESPEGITQLLVDWGNGDQAALDRLMPLVYAALRRLATNYLRRERMGHTLQPTALVNEAYLKLVGQKN